MDIKTLQWNIGGGKVRAEGTDPLTSESYCEDGIGEIIDMLLQERPDIVTLQETHESEDIRQAEIIAAEADYNFWVNDTYDESHIQRGQRLGQAVLSRFPLTAHQFITFTNPRLSKIDENGVQRVSHDKGLTRCSIELPHRQKMRVETFHMTPFHFFDIDPRSEQAAQVIREVESLLLGASAVKRLVQADFNLDFTTLQDLFPLLQELNLREVVQERPTTPKGKRLDHVYYGGLQLDDSYVRDDVHTDHYPVVTSFRVV